jgi:preprotein translocase subunit SecG
MFESIIWLVHVLAAAGVIGLVLLQHGKGADLGAAFGSGSAGSLFGSSGAANFLSRSTAILATVFFLTSLLLTWFGGHQSHGVSVMQKAGVVAPADAPAPAIPASGVGKSQEIPVSPAPVGVAAPVAPAGSAVPAGVPAKP